MLNLFRKEVIFLLIICISFSAGAQVKKKFQPNYDAKPMRFGYFIGFANTHYDVRFRPSFPDPNQHTHPNGIVYSVTSPNTSAIRAGAIVNFVINDYLDFRFSPLNISIQKRALQYINDNNDLVKDTQTDKAWLEFPFHLKYKSERRNNTRMYAFAGTRFAFETNPRNKGRNQHLNNTSMRSTDLMVEYGVGLEFFREYFKITPELHFSHGLFNMMRKDNERYFLEHVKSLKTHNVSLLIMFQ